MKNQAYDVFLSFSVNDRNELVIPLLAHLQRHGLRVWYSTDELTIGDSLQQSILSGLKRSRFGLFLITPDSIDRPWPTNELNVKWGISVNKDTSVLPVLHKVSYREAVAKYPALTDKWSLSTEKGLAYIAREVADRIKKYKYKKRVRLCRNILILSSIVYLLCLLGFREYNQHNLYTAYSTSENQNLRMVLDKKISQYLIKEDKKYKAQIEQSGAIPIMQKTAIKISGKFNRLEARYRNTYEFIAPASYFHNKVHVEPAANIDFDTLSSLNNFGFYL